MTIAAFDRLGSEEKKDWLHKCCGSDQWVKYMLDLLPYEDLVEVLDDAEQVWYNCDEADWLQAFSQHPRIGDVHSLKLKFPSTASFTSLEQAGVDSASNEILSELADLNLQYEKKNGFIFIVCATGRSVKEMLEDIKLRIKNDKQAEIGIAAEEQNKITKLRLQKLFT